MRTFNLAYLAIWRFYDLAIFASRSRGRVILRVADDRDAAAVGADGLALRHRVDGVVGALAVDVRLQQRRAGARRSRPGRRRRSPRRAGRRPARRGRPPAAPGGPAPSAARTAASSLTATISRSASRAAPSQVADVADVQHVEAAVGEGDAPPGRAVRGHRRHEFGFGEDRTHVSRFCWLLLSSNFDVLSSSVPVRPDRLAQFLAPTRSPFPASSRRCPPA